MKSEPYLRKIVLTSVLCTSHSTETDGSTFASSGDSDGGGQLPEWPAERRPLCPGSPSIAMIADVKLASDPPWSALVSIPMS